ncbi:MULTISPECIES: ATP-binding protein [unclassified Thioalkalivibrio]|uniref:sensor histidine kinase n=1 Tax=unclassified Thioalkalivibrio TaxID=2621013 RepID=UPI00037884E1|nr:MULTISPECIES: ATP-binding protein [unclassified Thioalkalivibrio]
MAEGVIRGRWSMITGGKGGRPTRRRSLLIRVILGVITVTAIIHSALFLGIDQVVSRQFDDLHQERLDRLADQVDGRIQEELRRLSSLTGLLARDADLINSTYYHLYLEGERHHPAAAVSRQADAFELKRVALWAASDKREIASSRPSDSTAFVPHADGAGASVVFEEGAFWLVAQAPIEHNNVDIAWLVTATPLEELVTSLRETHSARIDRAAGTSVGSDTRRIELTGDPDPSQAALDVRAPDTVARALDEVKTLLTITLAIAAVLLAFALVVVLRIQLRPVGALVEHLGRIARGEFGYQAPLPRRSGEFSRLVQAFNEMSQDLARLRDVERRMQHQEQLSAIGRVAARVAHDINNPLTVISSVTATLQRDGTLSEQQREMVDMIDHHTERCSRTVQELLEYGRPVTPRLQQVDLHALVAGIVTRQARRWQIPIDLEPEAVGAQTTVELDPVLTEQMLDNLIDNAAQASPEGSIRVRIAETPDDCRIEVLDDGPGFASNEREQVFEPFFTTKQGGTGLGLASVLRVVRAHNGDIELGPGPGGQVRIRLPLRQERGTQQGPHPMIDA